MVSVLLGIQYVGMVILTVELIFLCSRKPSRLQMFLVLVLAATLVNFVGYLFEMKATTAQEALNAVKFLYLGKPFIVLGTFLFVMEYCKIRLPRWFIRVLCAIHIMVTSLVLTCDSHKLYYSSMEFVEEGLFPHLVFGHGPVYIAYFALLFLYLFVMLAVCGKHYRQAETKAERIRGILLAMISLVSLIGLLVFFSGITQGYDSTVPAYVISASLLLVLLWRYNILDTLDVAKDRIVDEFAEGLVVVDEEERLLYFNEQARAVFPEIKELSYKSALEEVMGLSRSHEKKYVKDRIYEVTEKEIRKHRIFYGRIYIVSDITESYIYTVNLEKQKTIAEQANRAKTDFLARMSHEIRTPINSVLGMNEMILRESTEEAIREYASNIRISANTLLEIINDILDSSKIESGRMELLPVEYELDSLLNDLVNMISVRATEKNLNFEVVVDSKLPNRLFGDDVRIKQVLLNLLTNAVKYTPEGTVRLSLSGKTEGNRAVLHCEVADTGIGIKEEDIPRLFAEFERIEESRNRTIEGTGLGMSIVNNLLSLMGTKLEVESVYGSGTTFSFDLTQEIVNSTPIGEFQERVRRAEGKDNYQALFCAPQAKVLVVDDNVINLKVFESLLKETKVQVTVAESGYQCLGLIKKERFDVIFLDHMMPEMDGIETLHRLKTQEENLCKGVPVIILTANAVAGAKEQYLREGFDNFLSKPIMPVKLEQMLMRYLPEEKLSSPLPPE